MREHRQVSDRAFKGKSRLALVTYMKGKDLKFRELNHTFQDDKIEILLAEWEGIFEVKNEGIYFLKCKHSVGSVFTSYYTGTNVKSGTSFFTR